MGALHEGHLTLVRQAAQDCGLVVVSVFVNPTQFGPTEDFDRYPRDLERDAELCAGADADVLFAPCSTEVYAEGFDSWVEVGGLTNKLEGALRPGHFRGVTTVCAKLFNIVGCDRAYFGKKDYQQLKVVQKMVRDLNMPLDIVPVEIVREPDGLAMSSRNAYLTPDQRGAAVVLHRALGEAVSLFATGERRSNCMQDIVVSFIRAEQQAQIDYVEVVDSETLQPVEMIGREAVVLVAARFGKTRLIDNTVLRVDDSE